MVTITLAYDPRNVMAKKAIDDILASGAFKTISTSAEKNYGALLDKAIDEVEEGKTVHRNNFEDYLEKAGSTLLSKEEYFAMLDRGLQDVKDGKGKEYTLEELSLQMGL